ncbi:MAG: PQQ-binding-like beta-propeller repeat protein [Bryobacteraceae bacterium]
MRLLVVFIAAAAALAQAPPAAQPGTPAPPAPNFANTVRPFLEAHCQACHNNKLRSGDLNFEVLKHANNAGSQTQAWESTAYVLKTGRMPPPNTPRPPEADAEKVRTLIEASIAKLATRDAAPAAPPTREWLTWQFDPERTGWARAETVLSKATAANVGLVWKAQLDAKPTRINGYSTLTDPLIAENVRTAKGMKTVIYTASAENNVYALDAESGSVIWQRQFANNAKPPFPASGNCPNNLNATPTIDKASSILYVLTNEGKLRALGLGDGEDRMNPVEFTEPYSRNWSLNLIDGWIYTSTSRGCGGATSVITAVNVANPSHPVAKFYPSTGKASGPWGRGGIVHIPTGVIAQTADGAYDPASGRFGNSMLGLTKDLRLNDSYTPANWDYLNRKDFDLGVSSPTVFKFDKWTLVAAAAKEGVIYLLDAANLGGDNHMTPLYVSPRYGNDALTFGYTGVWGSLSTWVDAKGERWLLVPMMGPPAKDTMGQFPASDGKVVNGNVMAFRVKKKDNKPVLEPAWMSGDLDSPGMPVAAGGVVWVIATGDRARDAFRPNFGGPPGAPGAPGAAPRRRFFGGPENQVNPGEPGAERDAAWLTSQNEPGGQTPGRRFSGGRDVTHAVLYALDAETGKELYSSKDVIDSWNHYGGIALAGGRIYLSTYDARVYAFGLPR